MYIGLTLRLDNYRENRGNCKGKNYTWREVNLKHASRKIQSNHVIKIQQILPLMHM